MKDDSKRGAASGSHKRKIKSKKPKIQKSSTAVLSKSQSTSTLKSKRAGSEEKVLSLHRKKQPEPQLQSASKQAEKFVSFGQTVKPEEAR